MGCDRFNIFCTYPGTAVEARRGMMQAISGGAGRRMAGRVGVGRPALAIAYTVRSGALLDRLASNRHRRRRKGGRRGRAGGSGAALPRVAIEIAHNLFTYVCSACPRRSNHPETRQLGRSPLTALSLGCHFVLADQ